jgi:hypothetical protein
VLVADTGNHTIRRIDARGEVSRFAGTQSEGWSDGPAESAAFQYPGALAVSALTGEVLVADSFGHAIRRISPVVSYGALSRLLDGFPHELVRIITAYVPGMCVLARSCLRSRCCHWSFRRCGAVRCGAVRCDAMLICAVLVCRLLGDCDRNACAADDWA